MEKGGSSTRGFRFRATEVVLILVLMEKGGSQQLRNFLLHPVCLNPCFNGKRRILITTTNNYVESIYVLILVLMEKGGFRIVSRQTPSDEMS